MKFFRDLWWFIIQEKKSYLIGILTLLIIALLRLYPPYAVGVIIDGIKAGRLTSVQLAERLGAIGIIALFLYGLQYLWRIKLFGAGARLTRNLRDGIYRHLAKLSPAFYNERRIGDLMAHMTNDMEAIEHAAGFGVLTLADSLLTGGLVIFSMSFLISWKLAIISLLPMPIMAWATSYYGTLLHQRFSLAQGAFSNLTDRVREVISGIRVIKAFGQEDEEKLAFSQLTQDVVNKDLAVAKVDSLYDPTIQLIVSVSFFLAISFGSYYVYQGEITIGQLTQFTIYLGDLIWPMLAFGWLFNLVERGSASYERVNELLNAKEQVTDRAGALDLYPGGEIDIAIKTFIYPGKEEPALEDIIIKVGAGQTLGIVGKTGAGKTTLFRLLIREYDCNEGDISIGGISIYNLKLAKLRGNLAYVPQDHYLFSKSIAENIAFGRPGATTAEIQKAAKLAAIEEEIHSLPAGYETLIGERGVLLSGGQKQRLAIARALLTQADLLLLDDCLSAVDANTEMKILNSLREERQGKTTLIAAHRLSAVEHADLIVVLEEGRIREQGSHTELLAQHGWYSAVYQSQQLESLINQGGEADGN